MKLFFALCCYFFATAVYADALAPDAQIQKLTDEAVAIAIARQDIDIRAGSRTKINELIDARVLPHFNFSRMTALALGRNWPKASVEQQTALTNAFRSLLVRTYSSALTSYKNQVIEVRPLRAATEATDVTVRTQIRQPGSAPISIDYSMEKTPGGWKVYDVVVGGVSLVTNYRESFNAEIRSGGVDGLIKTLEAKNRPKEAQVSTKSG